MTYEIRRRRSDDGGMPGLKVDTRRFTFVVWDDELDRPVPFGRHTSMESAMRHVERLEKES